MTPDPSSASGDFDFPPGARVWVGGNDEAVRRVVNEQLGAVVRPPTGPLDAIIVTPRSTDEWAYFLAKHLPRLGPSGQAWVVYAPGGDAPAEALRHVAHEAGMREARRVALAGGLRADGYVR